MAHESKTMATPALDTCQLPNVERKGVGIVKTSTKMISTEKEGRWLFGRHHWMNWHLTAPKMHFFFSMLRCVSLPSSPGSSLDGLLLGLWVRGGGLLLNGCLDMSLMGIRLRTSGPPKLPEPSLPWRSLSAGTNSGVQRLTVQLRLTKTQVPLYHSILILSE